MRIASTLALLIAALSLVVACSEEPQAVAKRPSPVVVQRAAPSTVAAAEADFDFTDEPVDGSVPDALITNSGPMSAPAEEPLDELAQLEEALRTDPKVFVTREKLARIYLASDASKARAHAEVLTRARPDDFSAHYTLGRAYMKLSMWNEAITSLERALTIQPTSSYAHNNLGYSALQIGRSELALEHLEAILDLSPQEPYMMNNLGIAYEKAGRNADAYAAYLRALELKPGYVNAVVNKDRLEVLLSDAEKMVALDILEELAVESVPSVTTAAANPEEDGSEVFSLEP